MIQQQANSSNEQNVLVTLKTLETRLDRIPANRSYSLFARLLYSLKTYFLKTQGWPIFKVKTRQELHAAIPRLKAELKSIRAHLQQKRSIIESHQKHTDILNVYWHSKAEVTTLEKIHSRLKLFHKQINQWEQ